MRLCTVAWAQLCTHLCCYDDGQQQQQHQVRSADQLELTRRRTPVQCNGHRDVDEIALARPSHCRRVQQVSRVWSALIGPYFAPAAAAARRHSNAGMCTGRPRLQYTVTVTAQYQYRASYRASHSFHKAEDRCTMSSVQQSLCLRFRTPKSHAVPRQDRQHLVAVQSSSNSTDFSSSSSSILTSCVLLHQLVAKRLFGHRACVRVRV